MATFPFSVIDQVLLLSEVNLMQVFIRGSSNSLPLTVAEETGARNKLPGKRHTSSALTFNWLSFPCTE